MTCYGKFMLNKVFKNLFGGNRDTSTGVTSSVDLARAIPGYVDPFQSEDEHQSDADPLPEKDAGTEVPDLDEPTADVSENDHRGMADLSPEDKAEAAIEALAGNHKAWANNDLKNLYDAWAVIKTHENLEGQLSDLLRISHNLKGMAETYGYPAIGRIASSLCTLLDSDRANNQHALINLHVEACRAAHLQSNDAGANDQIAQSVCVALETQVKRTISN